MVMASLVYGAGILLVLVSVGVAGWYLYGVQRGDGGGFFSTRQRRLAIAERLSLEGGRRLVLIRRDGVEHLVMVGGPIDLVIETGIPVVGGDVFAPMPSDYAAQNRNLFDADTLPLHAIREQGLTAQGEAHSLDGAGRNSGSGAA
jgi:hypothetical protein